MYLVSTKAVVTKHVSSCHFFALLEGSRWGYSRIRGEEGAELELVLTLPGHGESGNVMIEKSLRNESAAEKKKEKMMMAKVSATGRVNARGKWRSGLFIWAAVDIGLDLY